MPTPLKVLSRPGGAKADVVLVGGIRHHGAEASEKGNARPASMAWCEEVASRVGTVARVLSFDYSPKVRHFYPDPKSKSSRTTVDTHSKALLQALEKLRDAGKSNRPIIFVAHDLGGLVCANGLTLRNGEDITKNTYGIVFCDTPFEGHSRGGWDRVATKLSALQQSDTGNGSFGARSQKLATINTAFVQLFKDQQPSLKVECFCGDDVTPLPEINPFNIADYNEEVLSDLLLQWIEECATQPSKPKEKVCAPFLIWPSLEATLTYRAV
ncbi:hypothetical protein ABW21_db0202147 [Orbilia brochopaga]|nr:hypothetical protein ABW21_db0202147 [Drechslerella brochopaga]